MYAVTRRGRVLSIEGRSSFQTYEEARQALRRRIRKLVKAGKMDRDDFRTPGRLYGWDDINRQPLNFTNAGFSIKAVG